MGRSLFAPYILLDEQAVGLGKWRAVFSEDRIPLQEALVNWTKGTDLIVERSIKISQNDLRNRLGVGNSAKFGISVTLFNNEAKIRKLLLIEELLEKSDSTCTVTIQGNLLGGDSQLITTIVLFDIGDEPQIGVATRQGSMLFKDVEELRIGFRDSGFPTAIVDFGVLPYHPLASWHLETSNDLDALFNSVFQLLINENDQALVKAIEAEKPTREQQALLDHMMAGIIEILLELAFSHWEALMDEERSFYDSTVGEALKHLLESTESTSPMTFEGPDNASWRRSYYSGLARQINAGRSFK